MVTNCSSLLLLFLISQSMCIFIINMDNDQQINTETFEIRLDYFNNLNSCLSQGIWTRYTPFGEIPQIGDYGIFDSDCYNIHNVMDEFKGLSNFLYFDCLDSESQIITKIIQFVDDKQNQHTFEINLDSMNYENQWFFFQIFIYPIRKKVQLIIQQNQDQIFFRNLDIMFPYYDQHLKITFGGGLALNQFQRIETYQGKLIFSYFPGKMYLSPTSIIDFYYIESDIDLDIDSTQLDRSQYNCAESILETFSYDKMTFLNVEKKLTEESFILSYYFSGWIKAVEIFQTDNEFLYKLIKISSNSEDKRLTIDNLCPFQLLYRFEGDKQFLQVLTYSYTFPSVTLDFSQNPFLIKKEVLLSKQISLWHYILVQYENNQLKVDFTFFDKVDKLSLNFVIDVNHFHYFNFKMQFGNLFENSLNYINFRLLQLTFTPCRISISTLGCDPSCQSCDGPTKNDCLSCYPGQKRIYLPESKSCVCPENMVEKNYDCITFENYIKPFKKLINTGIICQFGYFLFDEDTCVKCPSNIDFNTLSCLECIQNPYTWRFQTNCKQSLFYNKSDSLYYQVSEEKIYILNFTFDSINLLICQDCQQLNLLDIDDNFKNFQYFQDVKQDILKYNLINFSEFCNQIVGCVSFIFQVNGLKCKQCKMPYILLNNRCLFNFQEISYCIQPYYMNSRKLCQLCQIEYCIYCFEYLKNDKSKSTLYKNFETFEIDEFHSIGCALCNEGFQFNSILGKCIYQKSNIQNCIRSFIDLDGQEVCTLSNLQSFDISPEIINCQQRITNCKQCIQTPFQIIKCIVCDEGYSASIITGKCQICSYLYSKICIQGDKLEHNAGCSQFKVLLQLEIFIFDYVVVCKEGYRLFKGEKCLPDCNPDCLMCVEINVPFVFEGFYCQECPSNNYNQIQRSVDQGNCIKCPKLCSICQFRSIEEIKSLNPNFIVTNENIQFTYKCIQSAFKENAIIDSKFQIAKQSFGNENPILDLNFEVGCDFLYYYTFLKDIRGDEIISTNDVVEEFQDYVNLEYCNQQGIENIQITILFRRNNIDYCSHSLSPQTFINTLKQYIFTLDFISFVLRGHQFDNIQKNQFRNSINVYNFDQIKFEFMHFFLTSEMFFLFDNQNYIIFELQNTIFISNLKPLNFKILSTNFRHIELSNLTFQQVNFTNSIMLNISGEQG